MKRLQSIRQFNTSAENRRRKDVVICRLSALIQSKRLSPKTIGGFDPSLRPFEVSYLFSNDIERLSAARLESIEATILSNLEVMAA